MPSRKKIISLVLVAALAAFTCLFAAGCGSSGSSSSSASSSSAASSSASASAASSSEASSAAGDATLSIAYQTGLSYAPALIAKEQELIEKNYKEATGSDVTIEWTQMSSGADINTGITSGSLDVGMMGIAPVVTGITSGLDYKICANLSGQEYGLMTNVDSITSLGDLIGSQDQIALVNIGSIGHILLAKALDDNGFDAHALDSNLVAMSNPDGQSAVQSGSIACNLTYSTFLSKERADSSLHELTEVSKAWPVTNTNVVAVASSSLFENEALYQAVCDALAEGQEYIADSPEDAAELLSQYDGNDPADELKYLQEGTYSPATKGVLEMAQFMGENGFIDSVPTSYSELVYSNVKGD